MCVAPTTGLGRRMCNELEPINWLTSVPGLRPTVLHNARDLFRKYGVDVPLLDFFSSADGALILAAYRNLQMVGPKVFDPPCDAAAEKADAAASADVAAKAAEAARVETLAAKAHRRQRFPEEMRRAEGHYFSQRTREKIGGTRGFVEPSVPISLTAMQCGSPSASATSSRAAADDTRGGKTTVSSNRSPKAMAAAEFPVLALGGPEEQAKNSACGPVPGTLTDKLDRRFRGTLKSVGEEYGFIECSEARRLFSGRDVYVATSQLTGIVGAAGDDAWRYRDVTFQLTLNSRGQPQARNITWFEEEDQGLSPAATPEATAPSTAAFVVEEVTSARQRMLEAWGNDAAGTPEGLPPQLGQAAAISLGHSAKQQDLFVGTLKSFSDEKGYGFLHCESLGQDVFLRLAERPFDGLVEIGRSARFVLTRDVRGRPQARDVVWGAWPPATDDEAIAPRGDIHRQPHLTRVLSANIDSLDDRRYCGRIKTVGERYGFIRCSEAEKEFGRDVFVPRSLLPAEYSDELMRSLPVYFRLSINTKGQPQARDIEFEDGSYVKSTGDPTALEVAFSEALRW
eukprot:TRINITY_DN56363_c0_g1_i1.p1 TRINITY_DN56363_c0_g1~~TRINITY_DN56363_c0_g1_i1.p1  ORF type:complete len:569 (-),score=97.58 TRINITY_DN56363_c0_g1_i1:152-1858(-)